MFKRVLVGRPLSSEEQEDQRLPKKVALATFSSDAISSTAYASEEILFVTALGASSLALGLSKLVPIAMVVAVLLAIVVYSYRQTIFAYPSGGGSYIVSRENLGEVPSLVAGASLLIDYILTVAVSISAGVAAIISIPAFQGYDHYRIEMCLGLVALITLANLRGIKESGRIFAVPTYVYIVSLAVMVGWGLYRVYFGNIAPVPFDAEKFEGMREVGGSLGLFLILRGFSSGAVALSGIEAISNGVPAFQRPESKNAAATMVWMGVILGSLFFAVSLLASRLHPFPSHDETVISQMARAVVGNSWFYWVLQFATAAILVLAANTAYADFPRLASIIAADSYLPRQFTNQGDRLVFSNGVLFLAGAASALILAFGGITNALIPLYAIGVFTSFTLSQAGMVRHHFKEREPSWRRNAVINGVGSFATLTVALIVGVTKFTIGAWVPIVVVPLIILLFLAIRRHYRRLEQQLAIGPGDASLSHLKRHTVVVLVGRIHKGTVQALRYAESLRPDHITALYVAYEGDDGSSMEEAWQRYRFGVPLEVVVSQYRELPPMVGRHLDELDQRWPNSTTTVIIPEFVAPKKYSPSQLLHNQSALALKLALLYRAGTVVVSVPYHLGEAPAADAPSAT